MLNTFQWQIKILPKNSIYARQKYCITYGPLDTDKTICNTFTCILRKRSCQPVNLTRNYFRTENHFKNQTITQCTRNEILRAQVSPVVIQFISLGWQFLLFFMDVAILQSVNFYLLLSPPLSLTLRLHEQLQMPWAALSNAFPIIYVKRHYKCFYEVYDDVYVERWSFLFYLC